MKIFITIFKNDIKLFIKDKGALLMLFLVPVIFIAFFVTSMSSYLNKANFIDPFDIAVVDKEKSAQTRILIRQLDEIKVFKNIIISEPKEADELLEKNKVASIIIIPEKFSNGLINGNRRPVEVIGNINEPLKSFVVKTLIQSACNLFSSAQSSLFAISHFEDSNGFKNTAQSLIMDLALKAFGRHDIFVETEDDVIFKVSPAEYFTAALLVIFFMYGGIPAIKMLVNERINGITRRLLVAPVKSWQIVLSKLCVTWIICLIQFGIIIFSTYFIFNNYWGNGTVTLIIMFLAIVFAVSTWSILVASIAKTSASVDVIANLGILVCAIFGGSIYQLSAMPEFVRRISYLTINRWAMEGFMYLFSGKEGINIITYVLPLIIIGTVQGIIAIIFFKINRRRA